jgi:hypothetical protein
MVIEPVNVSVVAPPAVRDPLKLAALGVLPSPTEPVIIMPSSLPAVVSPAIEPVVKLAVKPRPDPLMASISPPTVFAWPVVPPVEIVVDATPPVGVRVSTTTVPAAPVNVSRNSLD